MGTSICSASLESLEARKLFNIGAEPAFGNGGVITQFVSHRPEKAEHAIALHSGQVMVQGETFPDTINGSDGTTVFAVYTSAGKLATGFNGNGKLILTAATNAKIGLVNSLKLLSDGSVLVVGYHGLAKLKTNGKFDSSFGTNGLASIHHANDFSSEQAVVAPTGEIKVASYDPDTGVLEVAGYSATGKVIGILHKTIEKGGGAIYVTLRAETIVFPKSRTVRQYRTSLDPDTSFGVSGVFDLRPLYTQWANSHKPWTDKYGPDGDSIRGIPDLRLDGFDPAVPSRRGFVINASVVGTAKGLPYVQDHGEYSTPLKIDISTGGTAATFYAGEPSGTVYGYTRFVATKSGGSAGPHFGGTFFTALGNQVQYEDDKYDANIDQAKAIGAIPAGDGKFYVFGWIVRDFGSADDFNEFTVIRTNALS